MRIFWIIAVLVVSVGTLLPGSSAAIKTIESLDVSDKLLHFLAYAGLACWAAWIESRSWALVACAGLVLLGLVLEFAQLSVPGRSFELIDFAADTGGVLCGMVVGAGVLAGPKA